MSLYLNKYFDRITCVCLPQRRKLSTELGNKIAEYDGNLTKFNVLPQGLDVGDKTELYDYKDVDSPKSWKGRNNQSFNYMNCFFKIIEKAKKDNVQSLLYFEDDVCILPHFNIFLPLIMENAPNYWEMIYFGPGHHGMDGSPSKTFKIEFSYLYRSELNLGMQAVAISNRMFDMLLDLQNKDWLPNNPYIDITIAHQFHKGNSEYGRRYCYGAFPYLVCETSGMSYNERNSVKRPEYELWKDHL